MEVTFFQALIDNDFSFWIDNICWFLCLVKLIFFPAYHPWQFLS